MNIKLMQVLMAAALMESVLLQIPSTASAQSPRPADLGISSEVAADSDASSHETYLQQARNKLTKWNTKIQSTANKTEADGKKLGADGEDDLNQAWTKVESAFHALETASITEWGNSKAAYEAAIVDLEKAWKRKYPK